MKRAVTGVWAFLWAVSLSCAQVIEAEFRTLLVEPGPTGPGINHLSIKVDPQYIGDNTQYTGVAGYLDVSLLMDVTDPLNPVVTGMKITGADAAATKTLIHYTIGGSWLGLYVDAYNVGGTAETVSGRHEAVVNGQFIVDSTGTEPPPHRVIFNRGTINVDGRGLLGALDSQMDLASGPLVSNQNRSGKTGTISVAAAAAGGDSYDYSVGIDFPLDFENVFVVSGVNAVMRIIGTFRSAGTYRYSPAAMAPEIDVEQPAGTGLVAGNATADFGTVAAGGNATLEFTVRNTGNTELTGIHAVLEGGDSGDFTLLGGPPASLVPEANAAFTVQFAPGAMGGRATTLRIASNDADENPFEIILTGAGQAPEIALEQPEGTDLTGASSTISFGNVTTGGNATLAFTVRNTGSADLTGIDAGFIGGNSSDFAVMAAPSPTVPPGGNTTFTVQFAPGATGDRATTLRIASNDADENPLEIILAGTGLNPDMDADGVNDAWENANGFSPSVPGDVFALDSDGDGDEDLLEIFQGTDRNGADQRFGLQESYTEFNGSTHALKTRYRRSVTQTAVASTYLWSNDLSAGMTSAGTFNGVSVVITEEVVGSGEGYEIVEATLTVTDGNPGRLFLTLDLQPLD